MTTSLVAVDIRVLYVDCVTRSAGLLAEMSGLPGKGSLSLCIDTPAMVETRNIMDAIKSHEVDGVIFNISRGWPSKSELVQALRFLRHLPVWFYWSNDKVIERIERKKLKEYFNLWLVIKGFALYKRLRRQPWAAPASIASPVYESGIPHSSRAVNPAVIESELRRLVQEAEPIAFRNIERRNDKVWVSGHGIYLRTDFWSKIKSGGSYGHTCYVAKELASRTDSFVCYMANRFDLLDELGVEQKVLPKPSSTCNELDVLKGTNHYYDLLYKDLLKAKPSYIYERYCVGNYTAAKLSKDLGIPYILEYNGSEISMKRSFDTCGYEYETIYRLGELFVFRQATVITVVSRIIADILIKDGVDKNKILINPNACSPEDYKPLDQDTRNRLRGKYNWSSSNLVIGFIGTFGGWHGIDVLAKAIPEICKRLPDARFLLIGDGNFRHLIVDAVKKYKLQEKVIMTGTVPQQEGARLLGICDILVSPHSSNMHDSRFFGSPTKLFEYMGMEKGIVASDLEQIGEILTPSINVKRLATDDYEVAGDELAVVCEPGSVDEFVRGVLYLAETPGIADMLGKNARRRVLQRHTWQKHVEDMFEFLSSPKREGSLVNSPGDDLVALGSGLQEEDSGGDNFYKESINKFYEEERKRYELDAPWIPKIVDFGKYKNQEILVIGCGTGVDVVKFLRNGAASVVGLTSCEELAVQACRNLKIFKLKAAVLVGTFEALPFSTNRFDMVFGIGILEQSAEPRRIVNEIYRVLKPLGKAEIIGYAKNSIRFWKDVILNFGLRKNYIANNSPISLLRYCYPVIAHETEILEYNGAQVKLHNKRQFKEYFNAFNLLGLKKRYAGINRKPYFFKLVPTFLLERLFGWVFIVDAQKPPLEAHDEK